MTQVNSFVHIVDDDVDFLESLRWLLESAGHRAIGFDSAEEFLRHYSHETPGCLLLDIKLPGMGGMALQKALIERDIRLPVIMLTGHGDISLAVRAMKAGALDFIQKPFGDERLLRCVDSALAMDRNRRAKFRDMDGLVEILARLSPREHQVLGLVVAGKVSREIGEELSISEKTVETHRAHIMRKTKIRGVPRLVQIVSAVRMAGRYPYAL